MSKVKKLNYVEKGSILMAGICVMCSICTIHYEYRKLHKIERQLKQEEKLIEESQPKLWR